MKISYRTAYARRFKIPIVNLNKALFSVHIFFILLQICNLPKKTTGRWDRPRKITVIYSISDWCYKKIDKPNTIYCNFCLPEGEYKSVGVCVKLLVP